MTTRREYGTGSLYQRRTDWRWIGTIEAGWTVAGSRRRIPVTAKGCEGGCAARCPHRAEIKRKLRDKRLQIEREGLPSTGARVTVKAFAEQWLEARRSTVRAKPWATDASAVRRWIIPTIGHRRLEDLTPHDIRSVATAQRKAGRLSSTARRTHITLTAMLKAAMIDGHQVPARVLLVQAPGVSATDQDAMPEDQLEAVLTVAVNVLPHWSRWLAQVLYGQRPAELLGLTWDAVDFDRKVITIEWQLQSLPYIDRANKRAGFMVPDGLRVRHLVDGFHLTAPKTKKGFRIVPLLPIMEAALLEWREIAPANPHGLVWPTVKGRPSNEKQDRAEWYGLQGAASLTGYDPAVELAKPLVGHPGGRYWHIYEARHAFATRLMEGGVDEKTITELMGHSSMVTSRGYQHVRQERALEALTLINERLTTRRTAELDG